MNEKLVNKAVSAAIFQNSVKSGMTLDMATSLIEIVKDEAKTMGINVVVAVSDGAGRPVAIQCMDDAYIGSFDVAVNKTYTAVAFKMSTQKLGELSGPGESLYGIQFTNEGKIVIFGGGEPIYQKEQLIGALGVSGGSAIEDSYLAEFGKKVFEEVLSCL
ncbi:MAG: heme-binding protein [Eubacteriales bacterium]